MTVRLAVYGTLKPGEERWPLIEDEMTVIADECLVYGSLRNIAGLYPAADLQGSGTFTAVMLQSNLGVDDDALLKKLDAIEGHPYLFERTLTELPTYMDEDGEWGDYVMCWLYVAKAPKLRQYPTIAEWPPPEGNEG